MAKYRIMKVVDEQVQVKKEVDLPTRTAFR
jgi:hypothetical protein